MKARDYVLPALAVLCTMMSSFAQDPAGKEASNARPAPKQSVAPPTGTGTGKATPAERIKVAKDFQVELLYTVPRDEQGSWVSMCLAPGGRLIVSDQAGAGLFEITPPPLGGPATATQVKSIPAAISGAQGLLWAFDRLYVVVNGGGRRGAGGRPNGLYRVQASKPGGELDEVHQLATIPGGGEHGPHAVLLAPDGKSLFCVCGNDTRLYSALAGTRLPKLWGDDLLFPYIARFSGVVPPAGCIYRVDPDGKNWELWSAGYRNPYDIAFNRHGDLFTFDSDMEWDVNTPWYRLTRILMATSGSDFGFRNGSNVSPPRYPDTLPAIFDVGPGSPTGVCFGYGSKFPAKYQEACFLCDWSYGRLFAVHLAPDGSAYKAQVEEFATGAPLALTDIVVNPQDGALYFIVGGRNTQSALYRIVYTGKESTVPSHGTDAGAEARALRHRLEAFHGKTDAQAVAVAWPYLSHEDRYIRFAARVAIEHQPYQEWQSRALQEANPVAAIHALLALVRAAGQDGSVPADLKGSVLEALGRLNWDTLTDSQRCDLLRVYTVLFSRLGRPDEAGRARFLAMFEPRFPSRNYETNADLCQLLVYLEAPTVAGKALRLIHSAPSQEEQMEYVKSLRNLKTGWSITERKDYFAWFQKASTYKGGQRFQQYIQEIRRDALATLSPMEREELQPFLEFKRAAADETAAKPRPLVKHWTLDELAPLVENGLSQRHFDRGRLLFGEAKCFACHRFANEGGALGPDLTVLSGRYSPRDFLEKILNPNKAISDQYAASVFTLNDGRVIVGRVVNLQGDSMSIQTDMLSPARLTRVRASTVESTRLSDISLMPTGLLDSFQAEDILDLMAYVLSRGDRNHVMFQQASTPTDTGRISMGDLPEPDADGFIRLFNGKDLTGWEGLEGYWSVKDGILEGSETREKSKQTFLVLSASKADPKKFANFELHFQYKFATPAGNSGLQFRSKILDEKTFRVGGYQADFDANAQYDGGFYDEAGVAGKRGIMANRGFKTTWDSANKRSNEPLGLSKEALAKAVKKGDWNSMVVTARGNTMRIAINGQTLGELVDNSPKAVPEGVIAFQLHAGFTMAVQFKDVKIKLLAP
ncbi:MAG TPA: family 16 glycoside hydrolase [Gemmataceae bacterium]|nr:family 16 glycoside hydrolase [Gemmataceae bacterium]